MLTNKKNRYLLFTFERETIIDNKTNLSLWNTKPNHFVESVCVWSFFWCRFFFPHLDWVWRFTKQVPVFTQNVAKCRPDQPRMQIIFTQLTSEHCFIILIPLYSKLIAGSFHINSTNDLNHDVSEFDETLLIASFLRFE